MLWAKQRRGKTTINFPSPIKEMMPKDWSKKCSGVKCYGVQEGEKENFDISYNSRECCKECFQESPPSFFLIAM